MRNVTTTKYEVLWSGAVLSVTLLLFGVLTRFQFGAIHVDLESNGLIIPTFFSIIFTFLWLMLISLALREAKYKFSRSRPVILLIVYNTLTLLATALLVYGLFVVSAVGGLADAFINRHKHDGFSSSLFQLSNYAQWITIIIIPLLITFEIYLIIKRRKIAQTR